MSLAIAFKGPEGIVLAADSRVTINFAASVGGKDFLIPAFYDNATKLLKVQGQDYAAAVTYGLGALGEMEPRTAHSFLPEFEAELGAGDRLSVEEFAERLSSFFLKQHAASGTKASDDMLFLVAGYDESQAYGQAFEVKIPGAPKPVEHNASEFGLIWGGQASITSRILHSIDNDAAASIKTKLNIKDTDFQDALNEAKMNYGLKIPYQFLPLQDCVDLSILLIKTTAQLMQYVTDVRGVGGEIDVATITRTEGFQYVQSKSIQGERGAGGVVGNRQR